MRKTIRAFSDSGERRKAQDLLRKMKDIFDILDLSSQQFIDKYDLEDFYECLDDNIRYVANVLNPMGDEDDFA